MKIEDGELFEYVDDKLAFCSKFDFITPLFDIFKSVVRDDAIIMIERTTSPASCRRELKKFGIRSWSVVYEGDWFFLTIDSKNLEGAKSLLRSIGAVIIA